MASRWLKSLLGRKDVNDLPLQPPLPEEFKAVVIGLLTAIADGRYEAVAATIDPESSHIDANGIAEEVVAFGKTVVRPPDDYFEQARICTGFRYRSDGTPEWHVDAPLWTAEEGSSDLEVRLNIRNESGRVVVQILNVRVP